MTLQKEWPELTEYQRDLVCINQSLPAEFISSKWPELTEDQRYLVCENQSLPAEFISSKWPELTEDQRKIIGETKTDYPDNQEKIRRAREYAAIHGLIIEGDHLLAFRNHDRHGRGAYKKSIRYTTGILNEDWHCDPRPYIPNSFGLGIWPKGNISVRVPLDRFVVAIQRNDGKARVEAFEIITKQ